MSLGKRVDPSYRTMGLTPSELTLSVDVPVLVFAGLKTIANP
ncbi:hypothetical protein MPNT_350012 [Candidatus Methylacidithermus pantelleriae]|uniref:Uncharacterized protein n=1 Tax=Candidatus Methylacidithermus pantelleriae TaxID=2744239 RepID=A0A8J2BQZ5_9BACT|nr:hypothetical protein MPNT_350012 [Candidatus Methylacidithermus pantelleriae]